MQTSKIVRAALALAAVSLAATACSGGGRTTPQPSVGTTVTSAIRIVGVGDSLTAGEQSGGLYGLAGGEANPVPLSFFPLLPAPVAYPVIPPTQGNGYWALLWSQANGGANPLTVATSPLPLMATPLYNLLVPSTINGPLGGSPQALLAPCTGANALAYAPATALQTRLNPTTTPFDLGIPGQTLHEALYQIAPTTTCAATISGTNVNIGLSTLVDGESATFYPILGTFGTGFTQIQAAAALHAQYATVWLGSNDLLKYALSGGALPATDPTQFYNDMVTLIHTLQASGAKVAVANLFDVLDASYFTSAAELTTLMNELGVPSGGGSPQAYYLSLVPAGGYLTLSGFFKTLASIEALGGGLTPVTLVAGDTIPGAFATAIQTYNNTYNAQIAAAVTATGATLVDVHSVFAAIYAGGGYPITAHCCSTIYDGGLTSLDGIHPSNTGYAIIANTFIQTLDTAYALAIPQVNVTAVHLTDPYAPQN
jgi:lysophospholipase L1-like esterase